jgi:peptidoglycan/xylan/chitin deacetylase (PgdA/CDA1 family)
MEYLVNNFNVLSLQEAVKRLTGKDVPDNAVVVTFDDGYRDNFLNAFPILMSLSIPATIFLATNAIGSSVMLWHDRVFSAFRNTRCDRLYGFGNISGKLLWHTMSEKLFAQEEVLKFLRSCNSIERSYWIDRLIQVLEVAGCDHAPGLMLSWDQVVAMQKGGISFGSHTASHPILSKLSREEACMEILVSKRVIEEKLGIPVRALAYPNGKTHDFSDLTKRLVRESGYECAVTTIFGTNGVEQDLFELRRATPWDEDIHAFALRLNYFKLSS